MDMQSGNVGLENMKDFFASEVISSIRGTVVNGQCSSGTNAVNFAEGIDEGRYSLPCNRNLLVETK
jgi:hypothetical protein